MKALSDIYDELVVLDIFVTRRNLHRQDAVLNRIENELDALCLGLADHLDDSRASQAEPERAERGDPDV